MPEMRLAALLQQMLSLTLPRSRMQVFPGTEDSGMTEIAFPLYYLPLPKKD
jgi:hypothetical protein